jgi:hypothetical protein
MRFVEIINKKKFTLLNIFLFLYVAINLFDGQRGLISYFEKKNNINQLIEKKQKLIFDLKVVEKKNSLLSDIVDIDYLETLYRKKFMIGKINEKIFISTKNED